MVLATGDVTLFAGTPNMPGHRDDTGALAKFNLPRSITYDGAGALYVFDGESERYVRLDAARYAAINDGRIRL